MTEKDMSTLITSIDENDIEIISSNDSEIDDQLTFVSDHFSIHNRPVNSPVASIQTVHPIIRLNRQESEEFEDETFIERVYALKEMFPDWLQILFQNSYYYSNYLGQIMKKSIWFCTSSMIVLLLPILFALEFSQFNEIEAAQARQILLGPSVQTGSNFAIWQK